jgi:hypothetical protein
LDVVCGEDKWDVLLIEQEGRIQAAMPLYIPYRGIVSMPPLTQTMGPWFAPSPEDAKYTPELGRRQALCNTFIEYLKPYPRFLQNFSYHVTDWLPFYWNGYKQTTRYTYILKDIGDWGKVWKGMKNNKCYHIKQAEDKYHISVKKGIPMDAFLNVYARIFERQEKSPLHAKILEKLVTVCRERGQGDVWGGYDEAGNLQSAVFIAWQESSAYCIAGGGDPRYRRYNANSLAVWEAIRYVSAKSEQFDFEGSMMRGVECFNREFGAVQTPYFTVTKGKVGLLHRILIKLSLKL